MSGTSLTQMLALHLVRAVPADVQAQARLHLLDWVACVCGAWSSPVADVARASTGTDRYALLGNVMEMDDVHRVARLHPGPVVWPATLDVAARHDASLGSLLDAGVRGYQAMITLGCSFDGAHYSHFHPTSTAGGCGAAAAAGSLMGFGAAHYVHALGNAASMAGGVWHMRHDAEAMTKQLHVAQAARLGVWVAQQVQAGATGPAYVLEGAQGLFAAMVPQPDLSAFADHAGWFLSDVSFKPWGACRHAHPAIDAALQLATDWQGDIHVETYADALAFCDNADPQTTLAAKFSLQHAVAVVAVRGGPPRLADFEADARADPAIAAVRACVHVLARADFTRNYPAHFGAEVRCGDASATVIDTRGDPERPLSRADLVAKARDLMAWGAVGNADALIDWCLNAPADAPSAGLLGLLP